MILYLLFIIKKMMTPGVSPIYAFASLPVNNIYSLLAKIIVKIVLMVYNQKFIF